MNAIEKELNAALGEKKKSREKEQDYFNRLAKGGLDLSEDDWDKLSTEAQTWVNQANEAVNAKQDIQGFGGNGANGASEPEPERETKKPAAKASAKAPAGKAPGKAATKKAVEEPEERPSARKGGGGKASTKTATKDVPSGSGGAAALKVFLAKDCTQTTGDLMDKLEAKGIKMTRLTVSAIRSTFRSNVKALQAAGKAKDVKI